YRGRLIVDERAETIDVARLDEGDLERLGRKAVPFLLRTPSHRAGGCRAAVKSALDRDHFRAACHLAGELERIFVRFRAGVHEENRVEPEAAEFRELRGGASPHVEGNGIALKAKRPCLRSERFDPARMTVAERGHSMSAIEVEHAASARRVQVHAFRID